MQPNSLRLVITTVSADAELTCMWTSSYMYDTPSVDPCCMTADISHEAMSNQQHCPICTRSADARLGGRSGVGDSRQLTSCT